jgi:hypothetical protein
MRRLMMENYRCCHLMEDRMYEYAGDRGFPLHYRLQLAFHIVFCPRCARKIARLEDARELMRTGFFPPSPVLGFLENRIMEQINRGRVTIDDEDWAAGYHRRDSPEVSFRSWVVTGCIILVSLGTVILGMDFITVAASSGSSFLIPLGITIGTVVTVYGALFIGTHLKELSKRFSLR